MLELYLRNFWPRMQYRTDLSLMSQTTHGWSALKDADKRKRKSKNKASKRARRRNRRR
jgi:hypothetical protein